MYESKLLRSQSELLEIQDDWDQLWLQSDSNSALTRCQPLAIWLEHFTSETEFRAVTVWNNKQLVAAMPLVLRRRKGVKVAELPNNSWSFSGDLLLLEDCNQIRALDSLIQGMNQVESLAIWLDWIRIDQLKWWLLLERLSKHHQSAFSKTRFAVSEILTPASSEEYQSRLSKNHRKKMKRAMRNLRRQGSIEVTNYQSKKLDQHLDEAFDIEHQSWKGKNGSSIKSDPNVESYYRQLAYQLDREGLFALQFLRIGEKPIAFDLGYLAKGTRASQKISFDAQFARSSPGQLLVEMQIEEAINRGEPARFDSIGPSTEAIQKWTDKSYNVGRIFFSNSRWTSRVTVGALGQFSQFLGKLKSPAPMT